MPETQLSPERQPSSERIVPEMSTIGPVVDEVIDVAREQLERPISVRIWTWEDREFKVRVKHWSAPGVNTRYGYETAIQYHSKREVIEGFLVEEDTHTDDREVLLKTELGTLADPVHQKIAE
jgi:hypothetical protein